VDILDEKVKLWNDQASACMDNFSDQRLKDFGFECKQILTDEPLAVDIKSDVNIWKFNPEAGTKYDYKDLKLTELDGIRNLFSTDIHADFVK
jgi:hypothetical protein